MKRLIELRKKMHLKQYEVATKLNITATTLYKYEQGISEPNIAILKRIADFFNTSVDYIIEHDCEMLDLKRLDADQKEMINTILEFTPMELKEAKGYMNRIKDTKN